MYDVVIVGAGTAGLSAALILGRARRHVLVLNGGAPRNLPASNAHGFLSRDGIPPLELLSIGRSELSSYPNVEVIEAEAVDAVSNGKAFTLTLNDGRPVEARKVLLATGVRDVLPPVDGLAELWGNGVFHCPYCHGWEVRDRPWAILSDGPVALEQSTLFAGWASELVVLTNGASILSNADKDGLARRGVSLDERRIRKCHADGPDGNVVVGFEDATNLTVGAIFVLPHQEQRSSLAEALACETYAFEPTASRYVTSDAVTGATSVSGLYAAGDMAGPQQSLVLAAASGARAAYALNRALAFRAGVRGGSVEDRCQRGLTSRFDRATPRIYRSHRQSY